MRFESFSPAAPAAPAASPPVSGGEGAGASIPNVHPERSHPALFHYFTRRLGWGWQYHQSRLVWDFLRAAADHCRGAAVLDAGAGHQRYRPFFEPDCLYLAQEHPSGIEAKGMQGVVYDIVAEIDRHIPLADNSVRGVINTSVLEHVRHPEAFFVEAFRILEPGGRLYTHVPFTYPEHEEPYDYNRPTRYALGSWLTDAGFADVSVDPASSSITASVAHVEQALREDLLDQGLIGNYEAVMREVAPALRRLNEIGEQHLNHSSKMPIGWLSVATKPGPPRPAPGTPPDRATWLAAHATT